MRVGVQKELRRRLLLASLLVARGAVAFQANVSLGKDAFAALRQDPTDPRVQRSILVPVLTDLKRRVSHAILVDPGNAMVETAATSSAVPLDVDDCDTEITALGVTATGANTRRWEPETTGMVGFFQAGPHVAFTPATLESQMNITGSIKIRKGTLLFNRCQRWLRTEPIPLLVQTSGVMQVTLSLDLSDARLEEADREPRLVFDLHHSFKAKVEKWNVDKIVTQGKACKFKLGGQWDMCNNVEDLMKRGGRIERLTRSLKPLTARAKLAKLVEEQLMASVGTKVEVVLRVEGQHDVHVVPNVLYA